MSSSAVAPVSSGVVSSIKSLPAKLGSVASKVGSKISPLVHKVADSKAVSWGGEQVRKVVVPDQVIRGWQDVYKGFKTLERGSKTIHTVKIIRDPGTLTGSRVVGGAGKVGAGVGKAARGAGGGSGVANGASSAGKAVKAVKAAGGAKSAASGMAKGGDLLLREGTKVSATAGKVKIPGGFREITKVDVTKAEFIGKGAKAAKGAAEAGGAGAKSGLKIVRGAKFRLGGSGNAEILGKGMSKVAGGGGGAGAGAGELVGETGKGAGKGAAAAKLAKGAKAAKGAKSATSAAKLAKGAKGAAGKGGNVIIEAPRTTVSNAAKGFRKPFGISAIKAGLKNIFQGAMKAAKVSGIVSFAISLVQNGYGVVSGQIGLPEAMGSIVRDTAAGFVAGGFAAVFSGGVLAIAGGLGLTAGLPIFLLGLGASLLGFTICNALFNAILGDRLKGLVERLFGG